MKDSTRMADSRQDMEQRVIYRIEGKEEDRDKDAYIRADGRGFQPGFEMAFSGGFC